MAKMKAAVFVEPGRIVLDDKTVPDIGPLDALIKVTTTTICGTDLHILKGEYVVKPGLVIGHEPVGVIHELGVGLTGYAVGERRIGWGDHTVRPVQLLLERRLVAVRRADRRVEIRKHDQWRASRIPSHSECASQPRKDSRRFD